MVAYLVVVEPSYPSASDELPVGHETVNGGHSKQGIRLPTEGHGELGEVDGTQYDDGLEHL